MISLDEEQLEAVTANSPTLVNASAGSGKTRCLIAKIIRLIQQGADPASICAITFTNKAANEMKERLKSQCSAPIKDLQVSTIHSLCVRVIKKFIHHTYLNLPFSIYDDSDQLSVVKTIIKSREYRGEAKDFVMTISRIKSLCESLNIDDVKEKLKENDLDGGNQFMEVFKSYQDILFKNNACDFDDLLVYAHDCLKHEDCSDYFSNLWHHILVDEFQDTSLIQYKIINRLYNSEKTETFFVVADFNQSIYGWRGANPENINDFIKKYEPTICNLSYNYRCSSSIITHANKFLQYGIPMVTKSISEGQVSFTGFDSQEDEAEKIANALLRKGDFETTAILFRINARSLLFERAFARRGIPYKIIGALPYYKRRVAKDLLSALKAAANRSDLESLVRIVNVPKRGFGEQKQEKLLHEGWPYLEKMAQEMPKIQSFIDILDSIKDKEPYDAVEEFLYRTEYRDTLKKDSDYTMLSSFIDVAAGYKTIEDLILASTFLEEDSGHGVKLLSAHASKGLEFEKVLVVGVEDGLWPHRFSNNVKEEYRLFYVAISRAKRYLNISYSKSRLYRGQVIPVLPSSIFKKIAKIS